LHLADITFVRLKREFVYLAVVLDRFSRKVFGWNLDRALTARLPLAALEKALEDRRLDPGLVDHSNCGAQYAHAAYLRKLHTHGVVPHVSRPGIPPDNANCESFFRALKQEEVDANEYRDLGGRTCLVSRSTVLHEELGGASRHWILANEGGRAMITGQI
jgi:putative transposase